jgi:hypothetical protein
MFCLMLFTVEVTGQQWIGVSSQSPLPTKIVSSGSTNTSAEITVETPGFYLDEIIYNGKKSLVARLHDGNPILIEGNPDLQKLNFTLELPSQGNMEVLVSSSKYSEYTNIEIAPSAGDAPRDGSTTIIKEGESYSKDEFYPSQFIDSQDPFIVRNARSQSFQVYPLQYNPVTKVLRFYYQLTFSIKNMGGEGTNPLQFMDFGIQGIEGIGAANLNKETSAFKSGILPAERGSMLILCPAEYMAAISPLVEWRIQTGIATEIVNSDQFSTPEQIVTFVKEYYYNKGDLAYLLLVGDAKHIPPFYYASGSSDNYYSYLAGNDHYPDILVGRFSAESVKDVEVQVKRTLQYEKDPGQNAAWLANATGLASTLTPGDDGESDFQHVRNLLKTLKSTTYSQVNEFFDGSQGESDADGNPSSSDITTKINEGTGVIFYAGHGSPSSWATGSVSKAVVEGLNNTGKFPLIWSAACETGNFAEKYCLAEAWLRASNSNGQPTGSLAALMSSGTQTSFPPMEAQDKIAELMSNPRAGLQTMGAITVKGMMSMNDVYGSAGFTTTDNWILFGDPSLMVRTAAPKQLIAEHKGYIGTGRNMYSVKCNSADGYACISRNGDILGTARISEGFATIYLNFPASGDDLTLTVTAFNYLPSISNITITNDPGNPELCMPLNHSRLQPINSSFSWDSGDGGNPDHYLFYLGTDNPPTNLINGQKLTAMQLKTSYNLKYDEVYYWKVVPVNGFGAAEGKVMDFETVFAPDEDFEPIFKSRLQWNDAGMQKWASDANQYFDGQHSIRSGQIADNEFTSLIYVCEVTTCDFVGFWSKTSSDEADKLQFIVDGVIMAEWSGITNWKYNSYKIDPGMHQLEWRYNKNGTLSAGDDAAWLDNIHLPVHSPATITLSETGSVCEGSYFETSAVAENFFSVSWLTEGDGTFNDNNLENAVYKPGPLDTDNEETRLHIRLKSFDGCPEITKSISLGIHALPEITLPSDTIVSEGSEILLDATISGDMTYSWEPCGSSSPVIIIDSLSSANGAKTAAITVTSAHGCKASKEIVIHFNNSSIADSYKLYPNPSNGTFTLEPMKGSAVIEKMILVDREGRTVWENAEGVNIIGSKQISVSGLADGTYFLITSNITGRTVNPVVIQ